MVVASWASLLGPGGVDVASALTPSTSLDECQDEVAACIEDIICSICSKRSNADDDSGTTPDSDCVNDIVGNYLSVSCPVIDALICCSELATHSVCYLNAEFWALNACYAETLFGCSVDDLPCLDDLSSGSKTLFKEGPLSTANVVAAGALGLLVTIAAIV